MKEKTIVITTMIMVFLLIGAISAAGQEGEKEKLKQFYNHYIMKCISKSQSKAGLIVSNSKNLRSCGALSQQKVIFLTNYKSTLIDEMIANKVGAKPYKVDYYLNKRFYETIR